MIPQAELERVKRDVDLVALMQARGIQLTRRGSSWQGRCPFHDDGKTPSLSVTPSKGLWRCFGCGAGGDAVRFVELCDQVRFPEAVKRLVGKAVEGKMPAAPAAEPAPVDDATRAELLGRVFAHYRARLLEGQEGAAYLRGRGISDETLRAVEVGYCDGTLLAKVRPPAAQRQALTALGVLTERGREALAGCVVFPLHHGDQVVGLYGRRVDANADVRHLFLRGPRRGLWHAEKLRASDELFLCEGIIDALTLLDRGEPRVLALYGTAGMTAAHRELLCALQPRRVWLCLDADNAGRKAAGELAAELGRAGLPATIVALDAGKDLNEYFAQGKTLADFRALCQRALGTEPAPAPAAEPGVLELQRDGHRYRLRPLEGGGGCDRLRVHLRADGPEGFHIDVVDLYSARARGALAATLAEVFACPPELVRKELLELVAPVEAEVARRLAEKAKPTKPKLSGEERELGLSFLRDPALFNRIAADYERLGILGEDATKLVTYLCATSRQLDEPLAVVIQSRSAAGKSALAEATVALLPDETRVHLTRLTPQALFYLGEDALKHKLLCIEEEAGTQGASYSLRTMQSQKELTIASTGKDPQSGKLETHTYRVAGPVALLMTTTEPRLEEETQSRFVVLAVDESPEQTQRILHKQREAETVAGLKAKLERDAIVQRHHAAQRLLREDLQVVNPLAPSLVWPEGRLRARRDQKKLLALLRAVAYLRQAQKEVQHLEAGGREVAYIEVDQEDVAIVRRLAPVVLGPTLDELSVPARRLLDELRRLGKPRLSRREARTAIGWSDYQVKTHLRELVELEYLAIVHGGGKGVRFQYELLPDGAPPPMLDPLGATR